MNFKTCNLKPLFHDVIPEPSLNEPQIACFKESRNEYIDLDRVTFYFEKLYLGAIIIIYLSNFSLNAIFFSSVHFGLNSLLLLDG
jgi:hypothetical protein